MSLLTKILTGAGIAAAAATFASAQPIINYGFDSSTGKNTVTQTVTFNSQGLSGTPDSLLAQFSGFAALGIANATYISGDTTLDYKLVDTLSTFQVTNLDATQSDTVNFGLQSQITGDGSTNLNTADKHASYSAIGDGNVNYLNVAGNDTFNMASVSNQTLAAAGQSGDTYTYAGLPLSFTLGISAANACSFGSLSHSCVEALTNDAVYSSAANVLFGVDNSGNYTFSAAGGSNANLHFVSSASVSGEAEITYEYSVPGGSTPEPGTWALAGSALIGLGMIGKRRFAKKS